MIVSGHVSRDETDLHTAVLPELAIGSKRKYYNCFFPIVKGKNNMFFIKVCMYVSLQF